MYICGPSGVGVIVTVGVIVSVGVIVGVEVGTVGVIVGVSVGVGVGDANKSEIIRIGLKLNPLPGVASALIPVSGFTEEFPPMNQK